MRHPRIHILLIALLLLLPAPATAAGIGEWSLGGEFDGACSSPYDEATSVTECLIDEKLEVEADDTDLDFNVILTGRGEVEMIGLTVARQSAIEQDLNRLGEWSRAFWLDLVASVDDLEDVNSNFVTSDVYRRYDYSSDLLYKGYASAERELGDERATYQVAWDGYSIRIVVANEEFWDWFKERTKGENASELLN